MSIAKANLPSIDALRVFTPTKADEVPTGADWLHEVKYDGYRMMVIREQNCVRLISSGGHDWARHFPLIAEAALNLRQKHFVIHGEAVVLGPDGVSYFGALNWGKCNEQAQLYAFDMLAGDADDHRRLPLSVRKANLDRLLSRQVAGIFMADYEQGEIGHDLFRAACRMASKASSQSIAAARIVAAIASTGSK